MAPGRIVKIRNDPFVRNATPGAEEIWVNWGIVLIAFMTVKASRVGSPNFTRPLGIGSPLRRLPVR